MDIKESTARKLFDRLLKEVIGLGEVAEQKSKLYWLLEDKYGINKTAIVADREITMTDDQWDKLEIDIHKLKKGHPVQHISGKSEFFGRDFLVNENVLIPRPETEELVQMIIDENRNLKPKILDIGTGSGCIPIILDLEMQNNGIYGLDVSEEALGVASHNNKILGANVEFIWYDILSDYEDLPDVNILVCNPPYVPEWEKESMQKEVLNFEPHLALFAPAEDHLLFYRRVAEVGRKKILPNGKLYFEIHEDFAKEVEEILKKENYKNIRIVKDIHNKERIVTAQI